MRSVLRYLQLNPYAGEFEGWRLRPSTGDWGSEASRARRVSRRFSETRHPQIRVLPTQKRPATHKYSSFTLRPVQILAPTRIINTTQPSQFVLSYEETAASRPLEILNLEYGI
jgi:hypothetical protein